MHALSLIATFALAGSLLAQANYSVFGTGCKGSGTSTQAKYGQNKNGGPFRYLAQNNLHFSLKFTPTANTTVTGFEFYVVARSASTVTITTHLFGAGPTGRPNLQPLASSSMTIGSQLKFYRTSFTPTALQGGKAYFIGYQGTTQMYFPHVTSGNISQHYWRRTSTATWFGPFNVPYWSWRVLCSTPNAAPRLSSPALPKLGTTFPIDLDGAASKSVAVLMLGARRMDIDMTPLGAPGCTAYTNPLLLWTHPTSSTGTARQVLPIPNDRRLLGVIFYNQWMVYDPKINPLNLVFSNAAVGIIG